MSALSTPKYAEIQILPSVEILAAHMFVFVERAMKKKMALVAVSFTCLSLGEFCQQLEEHVKLKYSVLYFYFKNCCTNLRQASDCLIT